MRFQFLLLKVLILLLLTVPAGADGDTALRTLLDCLPMGTGSTSGTYFPLGSAFANVLNLNMRNVHVISLPTRGSLDNIRLLLDGEIRLAIVQSDVFHHAVRGEEDFKGENGSDLRALASLYPEVFQVLVPRDSTLQSLSDLKGKRVILGEMGSGTLKTDLRILGHAGIVESDMTPGYLSFDAAIGAMARGEWDAALLVAGIPTRAVQEMAERMPVRLIPVSPAEAKSLCRDLSYFSPVTIPAGTYPGQDDAVTSVALRALLVGRKELSADLVNSMMKTLFQQVDYLKTMHPRAADLDMKSIADAVPAGFLHEGTKRLQEENKHVK